MRKRTGNATMVQCRCGHRYRMNLDPNGRVCGRHCPRCGHENRVPSTLLLAQQTDQQAKEARREADRIAREVWDRHPLVRVGPTQIVAVCGTHGASPHTVDEAGRARCHTCAAVFDKSHPLQPLYDQTQELEAADKWTHRFMDVAYLLATWSKDPRTGVGAVVVRGRKIAGTGYNGFPAGTDDAAVRYEDEDTCNRLVIHAEQNAVLDAGRDCEGATLYSTKFPCTRKGCVQAIIQAGIKRVVAPAEPKAEHQEDVHWARTLLAEAGVAWEEYDANV